MIKILSGALVATLLVAPAFAENPKAGKKKGNKSHSAAAQIIRQLEPVSLTDEQTTKISELGKMADDSMKAIRDESGLTLEIIKKRMQVQKSLKDSGKKGKELSAAINEEAGLSNAQSAAYEKINATRTKFQKSVIGLLTDTQKESLPKQLQRLTKDGNPGNGKKKKRSE